MRLDGLGKPALVQSDNVRKTKVGPSQKDIYVTPTERTPDTDDSANFQETPNLGQILDILQKAKRNKKKNTNQNHSSKLAFAKHAFATLAFDRYQEQIILFSEEEQRKLGQRLSVKV